MTDECCEPKPGRFTDFKVADLALADWGRKEIAIAETEMPGLMAIREEYAASSRCKGARITGSLHMTIQTAVLIETLQALGAEVRWASCNIFSTQDHAAAAIAAARHAGVRLQGRDRSTSTGTTPTASSSGRTASTPNMILDDGGDATLLLHLGAQAEKDASRASHNPTSEEETALFAAIKAKLADATRAGTRKRSRQIKGVTEETTTGVHRLYQMAQGRRAAVPRHQRQRLGHQVASSTTSTAAASRWWTASSAPPT